MGIGEGRDAASPADCRIFAATGFYPIPTPQSAVYAGATPNPMKSRSPLLLLAAALCPAAILLFGACSKTDSSDKTMDDAKASAEKAATDIKVAVVNSWDSIKDFTYEKRADFSAGMDRLSKDMDEKAAELKAKFAGVPDATAKDRDAAVKEYDEARADLKVKLNDLGNATADTWADAKAKAAEAWKRVQAAYDRMTKTEASP